MLSFSEVLGNKGPIHRAISEKIAKDVAVKINSQDLTMSRWRRNRAIIFEQIEPVKNNKRIGDDVSELRQVTNYKGNAEPKKIRLSGWELAIKVFEVSVAVAAVGLLAYVVVT